MLKSINVSVMANQSITQFKKKLTQLVQYIKMSTCIYLKQLHSTYKLK